MLELGKATGEVSEMDMRRIQIRETIRSHFEKEEELFERGIKVLSLFFIDEVAKYRQYDENGEEINGVYGQISALFGEKVFSYPKYSGNIKNLIKILMDKNDIILDFFSGSATTAHAVMQQNAEDGGNRKFIMVQLPEKCDEKSEAYKAGYCSFVLLHTITLFFHFPLGSLSGL